MQYEFRVTGRVSAALAEAFPELARVLIHRQTVFFGPVTDEAHLYGLLARFRNLGLHVEEMRPVPE
ncbi:hypothetical protein [Streptomyces graminilatus]|uniref:hypothetical protein n=1 Tax=Streptomyces graminilatus TaxID=1464070 RepID=UPI0006E23335|nr:hypothetical protein [Streptomyces graminilatus]